VTSGDVQLVQVSERASERFHPVRSRSVYIHVAQGGKLWFLPRKIPHTEYTYEGGVRVYMCTRLPVRAHPAAV
jgi:hypothetical protein